ncbi:trafficking protein particle complex subunit 3-like [Rhopilema esculentum]|uniref:trafficking protein particle complex subunit 3-like n=1 Tax=Rhopilema esculentum TaxID=499914 RepID=UPI0031D6A353
MSRQNAAKGVADAKKVSGELFTLTYGALVAQLLKDYEADEEVNRQLERMGYNIGVRLIEDLLARSSIGRCHDFRETADVIAKQGFKTFLGISPQVVGWNAAGDEFSLVIENNPLAEFVELPEGHNNLWYSSILIGVIKGALEMVQMEIEAAFVQDILKGDPTTELRVKFIRKLEDAVPAGEE